MPTIKTILTNRNLFIFGLMLVIIGMTMSRFFTSLGQFILLGSWILEGDWKRKWQLMKSSRVLWAMSGFFLLHLVGLLWTSDFDYASNDIRVKLPLLSFPLLFITTGHIFSKKEITNLLWLFTAAIFTATIVCTVIWLGWTKKKIVDIREISIFNSHIRFSLMIDLVICFLIYDFFKSGKWFNYAIKTILLAWFITFLGILQSFTGFSVLMIVMAYQAFIFIRRLDKKVYKVSALLVIVGIGGIISWQVIREVRQQMVPVKPVVRLDKTPSGNLYYNDPASRETENGNLIWANICTYELWTEWDKRSEIKFDKKDRKGNDIAQTLVRYMTSKNLTKDSAGIWKLSLTDIMWIQKGTSNYLYTNRSGIESRIHEIINEYYAYKNGKNPTGHSFLMRLEFWKVGFEIVQQKWLYGVGTGDNRLAYNNQYIKSASKLKTEWRLRSHNQFLAVTISFGIIGFIVFLVYLFYPVFSVKNKHHLFGSFFVIFLCSMLNEDTLETQAGVSFFGFFYCFLMFGLNDNSNKDDSKKLANIALNE